MRWIVLSLLSLNLLVFGVQWLELQKKNIKSGAAKLAKVSGTSSTLTLLQEVKLLPSAQVVGGDNEVPAADEQGDELCFLIGPMDDQAAVERLQLAMQEEGVNTVPRENKIKLAPEYWVYLEPLESRKAAIIRLKELQVRKIDSYLIAQGELRNGISLGLFRNIDSAERMQARRIEQGFDAKIREIPKTKSEFWLFSKEEANMRLMGRISRVLNVENSDVEARQIFCKSVATGFDLP